MSSVERAAKCGPLFEFTPEFYIDAAINAFHGLRLYFHPTANFTLLPGTLDYISLIIRYRITELIKVDTRNAPLVVVASSAAYILLLSLLLLLLLYIVGTVYNPPYIELFHI